LTSKILFFVKNITNYIELDSELSEDNSVYNGIKDGKNWLQQA